MKKKIIAAALALLLALPLGAVPAHAVTPAYTPVSSQRWYISLQNALAGAKSNVTVPQGALDAAAQAGADAAKNITITLEE